MEFFVLDTCPKSETDVDKVESKHILCNLYVSGTVFALHILIYFLLIGTSNVDNTYDMALLYLDDPGVRIFIPFA